MFGSLMMLASGVLRQLAELAQRVGDALLLGQAVRELGEDPAGQRDVAQLDLDPGRGREGADDRQQRLGGQCRRLVGVGVDDLHRASAA